MQAGKNGNLLSLKIPEIKITARTNTDCFSQNLFNNRALKKIDSMHQKNMFSRLKNISCNPPLSVIWYLLSAKMPALWRVSFNQKERRRWRSESDAGILLSALMGLSGKEDRAYRIIIYAKVLLQRAVHTDSSFSIASMQDISNWRRKKC